MVFNRKKAGRRRIEKMIAHREQLFLVYLDEQGFEGTDEALILAQIAVYRAMLQLDTPAWAVRGDELFRRYLKKFNQKVPDYDLQLFIEFVASFWNTFRFILMRPDNSGRFDSTVIEELRSEFIKVFERMPKKLRVEDGVELEASNLMIQALQVCLEEDQQLLANAVFEVIFLIWYHYAWDRA